MSRYPLLLFVGDVYRPGDDSWLIIRSLEVNKPRGDLCLDLGAGSGVLGIFSILNGICRKVVFVDIVEDAIETVKANVRLNNVQHISLVVQSDDNVLRDFSVDIVLANPPYLPIQDPSAIDTATEGGIEGYEMAIYFVDYAQRALKKGGLLYLVYSSMSQPAIINEHLLKTGFKVNNIVSKHFFFETIFMAECVKSW